MTTYDISDVLPHIDPARLEYQQWVSVGMALKDAGGTVDQWESWSRCDAARYHPGECERKWAGFRGASTPVTAGTIVQLARDQGWEPPRDEGRELDWDDEIGGKDDLVVVKAQSIYAMAKDGIPTLPSSTASTKMLVQEAVRVLREVTRTVETILAQMQVLAKGLTEYGVVRAMPGVGNVLAPRLIAEIGDVHRFHSGSALVAYAGIDAPPYESGKFVGTQRRISKRGSSSLRKTGYEVMKCLKTVKPVDDAAVYAFMLKKESEGKPKKVAKIAALNKFLRIYYARVKEVYQA